MKKKKLTVEAWYWGAILPVLRELLLALVSVTSNDFWSKPRSENLLKKTLTRDNMKSSAYSIINAVSRVEIQIEIWKGWCTAKMDIVKSNVSSVGTSSRALALRCPFVKLYYSYRQHTNLFIFRFTYTISASTSLTILWRRAFARKLDLAFRISAVHQPFYIFGFIFQHCLRST